MPESSGTVYLASRAFVERRFGTAAVDRVVETMSGADREALRGITAVGFYDLSTMLRFQRAIDGVLGDGSLAMCREIGRFSAEWQLNLFHRLALRMKRPSYLLERAASVWRQYHSVGRWEVNLTDRGGRGELYEFGADDHSFCIRLQGWLERAFELCAAKDVSVVEQRCATEGAPCCEFAIEYRS
jgi:hypothetical protein